MMTAEGFLRLAAGYGDPDTIRALFEGQLSRHRLLVAEVIGGADAAQRRAAGVEAAIELLLELDESHPDAVREVLGRPHIAAWASVCLRRRTDLGHLRAIAAAAASLAGVPHRIDAPAWRPQRRAALEPGYALVIEDEDPYRDCYQWAPAPRLSDAEADAFAAKLEAAWRLLVTEHPEHAAAMRIGLRSVVPLRRPPGGGGISAASRLAAGSVAVSIPETAQELALLLLHEFMHMKLGALLDIVDLCEEGSPERLHAPWRLDPRPPEAMLQGIYAHLGVADFWRMRRKVGGGRFAEIEFAYWREQTWQALRTLSGSERLTANGRRFVEEMRSTMLAWRDEPVDPAVADACFAMVAAQRARWRLVNYAPAQDEVERLAAAWRTGDAVPIAATGALRPPGEALPAGPTALVRSIRAALDGEPGPGDDPADAALAAGDPARAARGYLGRLDSGDSSDETWVGLVVAAELGGFAPGAPVCSDLYGARMMPPQVFRDRPELVRAVVERLRPASPAALLRNADRAAEIVSPLR
ncbi:aKG-HExxH-type peptide beta-hydroxylase [Dactylosporangium darangshiense]|uniref:HEXXH motif domain-containing protein n=1 Tax=Dactylosporangium darangshiense TaxID=579108 RepID=A0ABP8DLL3_9ACTN